MLPWRCPEDRAVLVVEPTAASCRRCGTRWPVEDGLLRLDGGAGDAGSDTETQRLLQLLEQAEPATARGRLAQAAKVEAEPRRSAWLDWLPGVRGGRVLELGSGLGDDTPELCRDASVVASLQATSAAARYATRSWTAAGLGGVATAVVADLGRLPIPDEWADAVVLEDRAARGFGLGPGAVRPLAEELQRVVTPRGAVLITTGSRLHRGAAARTLRSWLGLRRRPESVGRMVKGLGPRSVAVGPSIGEWARELRGLGFGEQRRLAPLPDDRWPQVVVPLDAPAVQRYFLDHLVRRGSRRVDLALRVLAGLAAAGLFGAVVPDAYLVARRSGRAGAGAAEPVPVGLSLPS